MQLDPMIFLKLMVGAFAMVIVAFTARGLSTVAFGADTAQVVAAPLFIFAVLLVAVAFVLALLVKVGIIDDGYDGDEAAS